ncbi:MAG: ABC transporter permease [Planctomycetaceae bacterium]|nr:ABC transporter permease [Planctomycetaceae bacterium]
MTNGMLLPVWSLTLRELVRFVRQRSRAIGAFLQPVIFWVLFGTGFSESFRMQGVEGGPSYAEFFLPGIAAMIVMFAAIFSAISVIQDRNEGFLQGVLVAPVPRTAIVFGKLCGGTLLAVLQGLLFLGLAAALHLAGLVPDVRWNLSFGSVVGTIAFLGLMGFALCGLGYMFAWRLDSIQGFHAIMSVLLFPMWLLSGAFFEAPQSGWLKWVIAANPLTYGVAGLKRVMASDAAAVAHLPSMALCVIVSVAFAVVCVGIDVAMTRKQRVSN